MAAKGIELASAYVSLSFSTDRLPQELKSITRGIKDVEVDVDANTKGAAANVRRWRASEEHDPLNIKVDVDTRVARNQMRGLSRELESFGRSDILRLNLGAAGIASLPALASGLAEVAAAIQQVAQAGLALPGIMAGATASIGGLVFGLSGVGDAYDAMNKAADDAAKSGKDVAAQQRAEMSASFGLRNAIMDQAEARKDVNRAIRDTHRNLQDLNLEMRGGIISEKRAVLEAQRARERLYSGDFTDYRDALLDVEEADLRVEETRARNVRTAEELNDANSKGIANSDLVVAANERLIRSEQGVAQAQAAVAAAAPAASAAQENAALAMSKLSPNAQEFVNTLMDLQGPVQTLRNLVQDNIFKGMSDQLRSLAGKSMPMLEKGLGGIGDAWNRTFTELFRVAGEDDTQGILSRIFGNTEEAQNILTGGIDPLVEGLGVLSEAGSRALPRMAEGFVTLADRFADFITQADESGKLDEWINDGIAALGHLGETALNVGKMFTAITNVTDGTFLENLESWTNSWQTWLNSAEGQETLTDLFDEGKRIFQEWKPILEDIPGLFRGIYDGASVWIGAVREVVAPITEFLKDHPDLVKTAAMAYLAFKSAQVLDSFTGLLTMFSTTLPTAASTSGDKAGKGFAGKFGNAIKTAGWTALGAYAADQIAKSFDERFNTNFSDMINAPGTPMWILKVATDALSGNTNTLRDTWQSYKDQMPGLTDPTRPVGTNAATGTPGPDALGNFFTATSGATSGGGAYGLPSGTDTGGYGSSGAVFPDWVHQLEDAFGIKASTYSGHQESNRNEPGYAPNPQGLNRGIDWSGPVENMQRFADYLAGVSGSLEQVIWQNPSSGATVTIAGGVPVSGYYDAGTLGEHQNHVHTRQSMPIPLPRSAVPLGPPLPASPSPARNPLEELLNGVPKFDTGGWWPSNTLGMNTTGQPEYVLTPQDIEFLQSQGVDPASLQHGTGGGMAPGPQMPARTEGYIPAAAGNTAPVGQGGISSFLDLGESAIHGLIDTGAQLGSMAVSAAAAAGSFGAGAAAGPAASAAIQMGAQAAKRGVSYGYDMAGIWAEALVEQAFPFGAPRWLGSADPMAFMPQGIPGMGEKKAPGTMGAAKTAIQSWAQPGNPALANGTARQGAAAALNASHPGPHAHGVAPPGTPPTPAPTVPPPAINPADPSNWLNFGGIFDQGGMLQPRSFGINLSKKPEYVFTQRQMANMARTAGETVTVRDRGGETHFHGQDNDEMFRRWQHEQRRQSRRHSGRPY